MKTDNSHFQEKLSIRIEIVNSIQKNEIKVFEAFSGAGKLWNEIKKQSTKKITVYQCEKEKGKNILALTGDNLKVMPSIDLKKFDIIDLDAYGIPYAQLQEVFKQEYKGYVIVTAIQSMMGQLPIKMLEEIGYTKSMIKKIPTLFSSNGFEKLKNYLYLHELKQVTGYFIGRKNYFYFKL